MEGEKYTPANDHLPSAEAIQKAYLSYVTALIAEGVPLDDEVLAAAEAGTRWEMPPVPPGSATRARQEVRTMQLQSLLALKNELGKAVIKKEVIAGLLDVLRNIHVDFSSRTKLHVVPNPEKE